MKSRLVQAIILVVLFVVSIVLFANRGGESTPENTSGEGYIPPAP